LQPTVKAMFLHLVDLGHSFVDGDAISSG